MQTNEKPFVVLKFGGTSVASAAKWAEITLQAKRVIASSKRCWLAVSAVTKITNLLETSLKEAVENSNNNNNNNSVNGNNNTDVTFNDFHNLTSYDKIVNIHTKLWNDLGLGTDGYKEQFQILLGLLNRLKRFLIGIELCGEVSPRMRAQVCSFGELMSSFIGLQVLRKAGLTTAQRVDARQCLISKSGYVHEEDAFLQACVDPSYDPDIIKKLDIENAECVITQGFIASTADGHTCLLGRGGSDTSAALFASLIGAERLEIWTDVHGLFTSDPRNVKGTRLIKETTYRVAQELASMGAKVLHPRCLVPASWGGIPVEIHNTEDPNGPFTRIVANNNNKSSTNGISERGKTTLSPRKVQQKVVIVNNDKSNESKLSNGNDAHIASLVSNKTNILAVTCRNGQGLVHIDSVDMWGESGFLAKVFQPFREMDVSVDLVATSQYAVSLTLDHIPGGFEGSAFARVIYQLKRLGTVRTRYPCSVVSIVGEYLRSGLPEIGNAMKVLKNHEVHLMTQSCEDLNMSFVVDENVANNMVQSLHKQFFSKTNMSNMEKKKQSIMGETWEELKNSPPTPPSITPADNNNIGNKNSPIQVNNVILSNLSPNSRKRFHNLTQEEKMLGSFSLADNSATVGPRKWWLSPKVRDTLLTLGRDGSGHYVYDETTILERATNVQTFLNNVVDKFYYAMKANSNQRVLSLIASTGFGMECVSIFEVRYVRKVLGKSVPILFSPNFCSLKEYQEAIQLGAQVIVDDIEIIKQDPSVFKGKKIAFRVDPVEGEDADDSHGHHKHVRTSGAGQKFGLRIAEVANAAKQAKEYGIVVVGLHSHVGSGVLKPTVWRETAITLSKLLLDEKTNQRKVEFENVEWLDLGGGLGVAGQNPDALCGVNLGSVADALNEISRKLKSLKPKPVHLHMEPGRYLVSEGGVLVTNVTQIRQKRNHRFVGVATGMNTLIRPALYNAWHDIVNITFAKKTEYNLIPADNYYEKDTELLTSHIVGPICETADVLGHSRNLPTNTAVGDVILIANAGAYGYVMGSNYNMREPASEIVIEHKEEDFVQQE